MSTLGLVWTQTGPSERRKQHLGLIIQAADYDIQIQ